MTAINSMPQPPVSPPEETADQENTEARIASLERQMHCLRKARVVAVAQKAMDFCDEDLFDEAIDEAEKLPGMIEELHEMHNELKRLEE